MASTNVVNLNTYTSKRVVVTNATAPAVSTSQVFYPIFSNSTTTGSQDLRNTDRVYLWEDSASSYFNVGNDNTSGGLTLHDSAFYVNIVPTTLTTTRTLTIPNLSGTICLTEGMPSLSIGQRETTTDPSTLTYSDRISIIPYFHIGGPWKIKSADDATNAHLALFYGNTELLRIRHDGTQLIDWNGNAATATALTSNAGGTEQPIYFSNGKPAATSYALKATVNDGDANYVAYYSDARAISSSKAATTMIMPAHYYHNLYNNNPTTGTTVYVHYYNGDTTSTNTFANLRVKSGTSYKTLAFGGDGTFTWDGTSVVINSGTWGISITGNAETATQSQYLMNRGGTTVSIGDSTWAIQFTPSGHTNRATVFTQKWTQSGLTYTPSGGSATAISDTADFKIWLSSSNTSNALQANMQIDGQIYSLAGFKGNLTGNVTGNCSGSSGSCTGNAATATKLKTAGTTGQFYRGDRTWSNTLVGAFTCNSTLTVNAENSTTEGGQICLQADPNHSTYHAYLDVCNNYFRVHSNGQERFTVNLSSYGNSTFNGLVKITNKSNTVTIGSANTSWCHIENSAAIPFYFNQSIGVEKGKTIGFADNVYRPFQIYLGRNTTSDSRALNSSNPLIEFANSGRDQYAQIIYTDYNNQGGSDSFTFVSNQSDLRVYAPKVHGAVWNDYAECRNTEDNEPGYCLMETESGIMKKCNKRMTPGCRIISDTYGMLIGETNEAKSPIAVSGRVLVYTKQDRDNYPLGMPVCAADDGTVDLMTREEIINHPECIVGTVSEIPTYDIWYAGQYDEDTQRGRLEIPVNNRIWIYVR